ncbi:MAG: ATP-binding protein [Bacteroidales bacterium]|nr:ATP-binding protein [Bacteroidales bacterium]
MNTIIGRSQQQEELSTLYQSKQSEFLVVYGRRRVGKTFLIREYFGNSFNFHVTGLANVDTHDQLVNFHAALREYSNKSLPFAQTWFEAFQQLIELLKKTKAKKKVIFFDELPWMDTAKSKFMSAFEHFWNSWASAQKDVMLIVCGSSTSWLMDKIINNKGGLHNRTTHQMYLKPFSLSETELYLRSRNFAWTQKQIAECYMVFGGIPYYLSLLNKKFGVPQNVDRLLFSESGRLKNEFLNLYASLFRFSERYIQIVEALSKKLKGLTREEILNATKLPDGGNFTKLLKDLELCGFIRKYNGFGKKKKESLFQLVDFYTLFYFRFIEKNRSFDEHFWTHSADTSAIRAWKGYSFELLCLTHILEIKRALGIHGMLTKVATWKSEQSDDGAQIDLLIERNDNVINLCEMKFSKGEFTIDKAYFKSLQNKVEAFQAETNPQQAIHLTLISSNGLKPNAYSQQIQNELILGDLF